MNRDNNNNNNNRGQNEEYIDNVGEYFYAIKENDIEEINKFTTNNIKTYPDISDKNRFYNLIDNNGRNGLMIAVSTDNQQTLWQVLNLHQLTGINKLDRDGKNLLFYSKSADMTMELLGYLKDSQDNTKLNINLQSTYHGETPLMYAVKIDNIDMAELLITFGADLTIKDRGGKVAEDYAVLDGMKQMFKIVTNKYRGFTKSDMETIDRFFENPNDWSMCPVCLEYVQRSEGCMFMSHNCSTTGEHYHKLLYNKYKMRFSEKIEWCTICGRITDNHKHFKLALIDAPLPELEELDQEIIRALDEGDNRVFFNDANCKAFGGKGIEEKITRIRRFREYALELEDDVDKKREYEVLNDLIEEVWNSPFQKKRKQVSKILANQKWNIKSNNFVRTVKRSPIEKVYKNIIPPESRNPPTTLADLTLPCIISASETEETNHKLQFHHEDEPGGSDHTDSYICDEDLATYIKHMVGDKNSGDFGKCFYYPTCKAKIYPFEIGSLVTEDVFKKYIKYFNKKLAISRKFKRKNIRKQKGGNRHNLLHPIDLDSAVCVPPHLFKRKTNNNK